MKKKNVIIGAILIMVFAVSFVWSALSSTPHNSIALDDVFEVRLAGESIRNEDRWRHANENEIKQIIEWYNSADFISSVDNPSTAQRNLSIILIELNPRERHGDLVTKRGEIIMIFNSDNGFEVHREYNVYYLAKQRQLKHLLNELEES